MAEKESSFGKSLLTGLKELLIVLIGAVIVSALLRAFIFEPFTIPSGSMENTLRIQDKVVAQKVTDFRRGDVIVFRDPGEWVPGHTAPRTNPVFRVMEMVGVLPDSSDDFLTKRVIGMPGDRIKCCDAEGRITVNGHPIDESSYLYSGINGPVRPSEQQFEVVVPKDHIFVMGDHRNASADSRCHLEDLGANGRKGDAAFIPVENVVGPIALIVAPFEHFKTLRAPATFEGVPEPRSGPPEEARIVKSTKC